MLLAAAPWFYWLGFLLVLGVVGAFVATAIGYYIKVLSNKAPRRQK